MQKESHHEQINHFDHLKQSCCIQGLRQKDQETGCEIVGLTGSGDEIVEVAHRPQPFLVLMEINMAISNRGLLMAPGIHFIQKFFSMKSLAVKLRDELEDIKNSTQEYVILFLSFGQSGNFNNTGRMQKGVVPKYWTM